MLPHTSSRHRILLAFGGVLAAGIGVGLLFAPAAFHGANGIEIGTDINLLSEVRAPGGVLLVAGVAMLGGAFARRFATLATAIGAAMFLAYGLARLVAMSLDGIPGPGLVTATVIEWILGILFARTLITASPGSGPRTRQEAA